MGPSPATGPVTFVAGFGQPPNVDAARWLVAEVWPKVRTVEPRLRLRLVGRGAAAVMSDGWRDDGIEVVLDPVSTDGAYRTAALVVAPVRRGGGAQLKVTEALARGRLVVATPFSAAAAPAASRPGVVEADGAEETALAIVRLWRDVEERRRRERVLAERRPVPTWEAACRPLADAVEALLPKR